MVGGMKTILQSDGHIVLPAKVRRERKLRAGDQFEIITDPDEPGMIELRRVRRRRNEGLAAWLGACPVKGFPIPRRSRELPLPPLEL
jgi:AbrB family looped-hinge helix DNA binding protein